MNTKYWQHTIGAIHWYCATCNVKSVVLLCFVFGLQDKLQKIERKIGNMKRETSAKISKTDCEQHAVKDDFFEPENR